MLRTAQLGTAGGIRTPDLLVRSQTLYPAELQPHTVIGQLGYYTTSIPRCQPLFADFPQILPAPRRTGSGERGGGAYTPCQSMASATLRNPAMLAPAWMSPSMP